jgi:hypothetical protein
MAEWSPALAMGYGAMVVLCAGWQRGDWVAIPSMAARRGLRLGRKGYGRGIRGVWEEQLGNGWSCASSATWFLRAGLLWGVDSGEGIVGTLKGSHTQETKNMEGRIRTTEHTSKWRINTLTAHSRCLLSLFLFFTVWAVHGAFYRPSNTQQIHKFHSHDPSGQVARTTRSNAHNADVLWMATTCADCFTPRRTWQADWLTYPPHASTHATNARTTPLN